ncbi:hypothetical protein PoB_007159600, partial [Plakobranchus ocellatus]
MHAKIKDVSSSITGSIKSKDRTMLMEKKEILNRWSEYVEDLFKDVFSEKRIEVHCFEPNRTLKFPNPVPPLVNNSPPFGSVSWNYAPPAPGPTKVLYTVTINAISTRGLHKRLKKYGKWGLQ